MRSLKRLLVIVLVVVNLELMGSLFTMKNVCGSENTILKVLVYYCKYSSSLSIEEKAEFLDERLASLVKNVPENVVVWMLPQRNTPGDRLELLEL